MVSTASLAAMIFSLLLSFFLPPGLAICCYLKFRFSLKALFVGVAIFIIFQLVTRLPLLIYLSSRPWFADISANLFFTAVIIGGFSAALFEECGRYLGFRLILKKELSWGNGLAYGLGHGGIESVILVGLAYINNVIIALMINNGVFERFVAPQMGSDAAAALKFQFVTMPPSVFAAAGVERSLTLVIQIALSLIVLYAVKRRQPLYLFLSILLHALLNAGAVYLQDSGAALWWIELYIAAFAAAALILIIRIRTFVDPSSDEGAGGLLNVCTDLSRDHCAGAESCITEGD